jgi:DNA-binding NtrC family response regulator
MEEMLRYRWPGNVRELKNVIERAVVLTRSQYIDHADLVLSALRTAGDTDVDMAAAIRNVRGEPASLADMERQHILDTLTQTGWTRAERRLSWASSARRWTAKSAGMIWSNGRTTIDAFFIAAFWEH